MTKPICGVQLSDGRICGRELKLVPCEDGENEWICPIHPPEEVETQPVAPLLFVSEEDSNGLV